MTTLSIADLCQRDKLSVADLSAQCGLEESRALAIVMGRWTPSPEERQRVAAVFGLTPGEISWGHKTPIQHIYGHGPG